MKKLMKLLDVIGDYVMLSCFLLVVILVLTYFTHRLKTHFVKENHNFTYYTLKEYKSIFNPFKEPIIKIYDEESRSRYIITQNVILQTAALKTILKEFPAFQGDNKKFQFKNVFDLLVHLSIKSDFNSEYRIFEYYMKNIYKGSEQETYDLLRYIDRYYIDSAEKHIESNQMQDAKKMIDLAAKKLKLIDTSPLFKSKIYLNRMISKVLLLNALFENYKECFVFSKSVDLLVPNYKIKKDKINFLDIKYDSNDDKNPKSFRAYKTYWKGVRSFRRKDFDTAIREFESIVGNNKITELSRFMIARSIFWKANSSQSYPGEEKKRLLEIKKNILSISLKNDIDIYIKEFCQNP